MFDWNYELIYLEWWSDSWINCDSWLSSMAENAITQSGTGFCELFSISVSCTHTQWLRNCIDVTTNLKKTWGTHHIWSGMTFFIPPLSLMASSQFYQYIFNFPLQANVKVQKSLRVPRRAKITWWWIVLAVLVGILLLIILIILLWKVSVDCIMIGGGEEGGRGGEGDLSRNLGKGKGKRGRGKGKGKGRGKGEKGREGKGREGKGERGRGRGREGGKGRGREVS